jgi:hypothetical protein
VSRRTPRNESRKSPGAGRGDTGTCRRSTEECSSDVISDLACRAPLGMLARGSDVLQDDNSVEDDSADPDDTTSITALIDYRAVQLLSLASSQSIPAFMCSPHRYAHWVPDIFVRRGVSGTEVAE